MLRLFLALTSALVLCAAVYTDPVNGGTDGILEDKNKVRVVHTGSCGSNCQYEFDPDSKVLTINGRGEMTSLGWRDYLGDIKTVSISNHITSIVEDAFDGCGSLKTVTIGASVVTIGADAFRGCTSLKSITIPNGVKSIGFKAFEGCSALEKISIPSSVTYIGNFAFDNCPKLDYNTYDNVKYLGNDDDLYVALIKAKETDIKSCTIPNSTKVIYQKAFNGCNSLESITIPNKVTYIGEDAFLDCVSLTSVTVPESIESIGGHAFLGSSLTSVSLGNNYTVDNFRLYFSYSGVKSITLGPSVTGIKAYAFYKCTSLTSIIIPDSVTYIGESAFDDCSSLTTIYLGNDNVIGKFRSLKSITTITLGPSITSIPAVAFCGLDKLTSINIPDKVTSIGSHAFADCSSLASITLPESITSIEEEAFDGCTNLKFNDYDNGQYLGTSTSLYTALIKAKDINITSCKIFDTTKIITGSAFKSCSNLTSITIPENVTFVGSFAFEGCSSLNSAYYFGLSDPGKSTPNAIFYKCPLKYVGVPMNYTDEEFCRMEIMRKEPSSSSSSKIPSSSTSPVITPSSSSSLKTKGWIINSLILVILLFVF